MSTRNHNLRTLKTTETVLSSIESIRPEPFRPEQTVEIKAHLEAEGWAAVSVIAPEIAEDLLSQFWDFIEDLGSGVSRNDPATWYTVQWPEQIRGILKRYGIGQADFMWRLRSDPNVMRVFADLWQCRPEDLLSSFDGACIYPVGAAGGPAGPFTVESDVLWPHRDQRPTNNDLLCYQSSVALADNRGDLDGGLLIWPRTHTSDWQKIDKNAQSFEREFYRIPADRIRHSDARVIRVPAGTLLLWDSRTVHANRAPSRGGNTRCVAFICMLDGSSCDAGTLMQRKEARRTGQTTSHWPFPFKINGEGREISKSRADPREVLKRKMKRGHFSDQNDTEVMRQLTCGYLASV